jgi:hypothetical protein
MYVYIVHGKVIYRSDETEIMNNLKKAINNRSYAVEESIVQTGHESTQM